MDLFKDLPSSLTAPATDASVISPNDVSVLSSVPRAIYVGNGGDLAVEMQGGQNITFANIQGGTVLAVRVLRVLQTGTTATGIVALW
jgi:hypothetical protein